MEKGGGGERGVPRRAFFSNGSLLRRGKKEKERAHHFSFHLFNRKEREERATKKIQKGSQGFTLNLFSDRLSHPRKKGKEKRGAFFFFFFCGEEKKKSTERKKKKKGEKTGVINYSSLFLQRRKKRKEREEELLLFFFSYP